MVMKDAAHSNLAKGFTPLTDGGCGKDCEGDVAERGRVLRAENFSVNYKVESNDRQFAA